MRFGKSFHKLSKTALGEDADDAECAFEKPKNVLKNREKPHKKLEEDKTRQLIEAECLSLLLEGTLKSLKMALTLPVILANPLELQLAVQGTEFEESTQVLRRFIRRVRNFAFESRRTIMIQNIMQLDEESIRLIDYFIQNHEILSLLPVWDIHLTAYDRELLNTFQRLIDISLHHIMESSEYLCIKEKYLHDLYFEKNTLRTTVLDNAKQIKVEKSLNKWKSKSRNYLIVSYFNEINKECSIGDEYMGIAWRNLKLELRAKEKESLKKKEVLNDELETEAEANVALRKQCNKELHEIIEEKNKYLIQLEAILHKYETTLLEKYKQNYELQDTYDRVSKEYEEFMVMYREEERIYNEVVVVRMSAEKATHDAMVQVFIMNRAAKKIQRWFRQYYIQMKRARKAHKGKKGGKKSFPKTGKRKEKKAPKTEKKSGKKQDTEEEKKEEIKEEKTEDKKEDRKSNKDVDIKEDKPEDHTTDKKEDKNEHKTEGKNEDKEDKKESKEDKKEEKEIKESKEDEKDDKNEDKKEEHSEHKADEKVEDKKEEKKEE